MGIRKCILAHLRFALTCFLTSLNRARRNDQKLKFLCYLSKEYSINADNWQPFHNYVNYSTVLRTRKDGETNRFGHQKIPDSQDFITRTGKYF